MVLRRWTQPERPRQVLKLSAWNWVFRLARMRAEQTFSLCGNHQRVDNLRLKKTSEDPKPCFRENVPEKRFRSQSLLWCRPKKGRPDGEKNPDARELKIIAAGGFWCSLGANRRKSLIYSGAGEGNRTLVCSLGSCRSTIELHPRLNCCSGVSQRAAAFLSLIGCSLLLPARDLWQVIARKASR